MHLVSLNITDLLISLFRGTLQCEKTDNRADWDWAVFSDDKVWKAHGAHVEACTRYLPGSFDRPPRNPALKIKSGYKAWEFLIYVFGLGPALLYATPLPIKYFRNFCRLVYAIRITLAYEIHRDALKDANDHLFAFTTEFEELYYQRREDRLHFIRQSIHALSHICEECERLGPQAYYTQWVMERVIGSFVQELRNHVDPYANLAHRGLRRAQKIALTAMLPELEHSKYATGDLPEGAKQVGSGYVLLRAVEAATPVTPAESEALRAYWEQHTTHEIPQDYTFSVARWARLLLPSGQVARSLWKESMKNESKLRISRNVKIQHNEVVSYGEIRYFFEFKLPGGTEPHTVAMVSMWGTPEPKILELSYGAIQSCLPGGDDALTVLPVHHIKSVVAMVPHPQPIEHRDEQIDLTGRFFVVEKPGLGVAHLGGVVEGLGEGEGAAAGSGGGDGEGGLS
ncbi:uncharacterized protein BXZ73DRAFT_44615 [Epithele typhae]|nr:uncharacterized protein BXZ73DRAFT_44615 [Epithele typhae]KAH9937852.1 hypothetical protein BXZ73DRAFT_44615 [Epithele typhae]